MLNTVTRPQRVPTQGTHDVFEHSPPSIQQTSVRPMTKKSASVPLREEDDCLISPPPVLRQKPTARLNTLAFVCGALDSATINFPSIQPQIATQSPNSVVVARTNKVVRVAGNEEGKHSTHLPRQKKVNIIPKSMTVVRGAEEAKVTSPNRMPRQKKMRSANQSKVNQ